MKLDAKQQFEKRVLEAKRDAIEENKKLAKETGNKLTQNVDKMEILLVSIILLRMFLMIKKK